MGVSISRKLRVALFSVAHLCDVQESGSKTDRAGWLRAVYIFTILHIELLHGQCGNRKKKDCLFFGE